MRYETLLVLIAVLIASVGVSAQEASGDAVDIAVQIKNLDDANFEVRDAASAALLSAGKRAGDALRVAAKSDKPEVASRAAVLLEKIFPPLVLSAEPVGEARVGQPVKFKVTITNVSDKELAAVRCLDGSTRGRRYPIFKRVEIPNQTDEGGKGFCGNCNILFKDDFMVLKPGQSFEPLTGFGNELCTFTPKTAGKIAVTFTCDYANADAKRWDGPIERARQNLGTDALTFARVPKILLETKVELNVKE